jgi:hypothetical protein
MKNVKKLLVGMFAAVSLTEMTYPIIFTGPARRNAHREQQEKEAQEEEALVAYSLGADRGRNEQEKNSSYEQPEQSSYQQPEESYNQEVAVQSLEDDEYNVDENDQDLFMNDQDDDMIYQENYADDAVVQIQSFGDGESFADKLTPEQKEFIKGRLLEKMKEHNSQGENSSDQVTTQSITPLAEEEPHADLVQAAQAATSFAQAAEQTERVAPVAPVVAQPALMQEQSVQPASTEQIKIVKVYPVFDAVRSAFESVKSAAQDMINYVYNYASSYRASHAEKSEVAAQ